MSADSKPTSVSSIPENKLAEARDMYEMYQAWLEVGFTEEQAMALLARPAVVVESRQAEYPPELFEFWQRQNSAALAITDELSPDD